MKKVIAVLAFLLTTFFSQNSAAQSNSVTLDGEAFTKKYELNLPNGDKLLEFIREHEKFDSWIKLVGFRYQQLPRIDNNPTKYVVAMSAMLKAKGIHSSVIENKQTSEAMIDFIMILNDGGLEFNVFRLAKSNNGNGIISLQFAHRLKNTSDANNVDFVKLRGSWINQAAAFDMNTIQALFAQ